MKKSFWIKNLFIAFIIILLVSFTLNLISNQGLKYAIGMTIVNGSTALVFLIPIALIRFIYVMISNWLSKEK